MGGTVNLTSFVPPTAVISLSHFLSFLLKVVKHYRRVFILLFEQMGVQKYICGTLPFTALQVNPTMTITAAKKPGNVKRVVRNTRHCCHVMNLANRETAVSSSVLL